MASGGSKSTATAYVAETVARARELLLMQGCGQTVCALANEEEAKRFLLANHMAVERAAEGVARRAKFVERYGRAPKPAPGFDTAKLSALLPMHLSRSSGAFLFISFTKEFDTAAFIECCNSDPHGKIFFEWFGEVISARCVATHSRLSVVIDLSDAPFNQTTTPGFDQLVRSGASHLQAMLPERLKHVYILNAPPTLHMMMYTLKRICSAQTMSKFIPIESVEKIPAAVVSQEFIPRALGGKQKVPWSEDDWIYSSLSRKEDSGSKKPTSPVSASSSTEKRNGDVAQEVEQLFEALQISIQKANECEMRHLEENARIRRKLTVAEKKADKPLDPEEAELRDQLQRAIDERDAYCRAVAFARNFIDQEMIDRREFIADIEHEIEQKRRENLALVEALKSAFGSDAPNLLL